MSRTLARTLVAGLALSASVTGITQTPRPLAFEVASVNPAPPITAAQIQSGTIHVGMTINDARVDIGYTTIGTLMPVAYRVKPYQVVGPTDMNELRFDIRATLPPGATKEQVPEMLQALLAERFGLVVHREKRELPVYGLVAGKDGPKLRESAPDIAAPSPPAADDLVVGQGDSQIRVSRPTGNATTMTVTSTQTGQMQISMGANGNIRLNVARVTMPALSEMLTSFSGRPVLDMTGLGGTYEVDLELSTADLLAIARTSNLSASLPLGGGQSIGAIGALAGPVPGNAASDPGGGSIFQAVQRLGLRLDAQRAPIDIIVIDKVSKTPTQN